MNKSVKNLIFSAVCQLATIVIGLIMPRLYLVCFGSEINGLLSSIQQVLIYLSLFEAGIGAMALQALYGPIVKDDWNGINGVLSATNRYYKKTSIYYLSALVIITVAYPVLIESSLDYASLAGVVFFSGISNVLLFACIEKYKVFLQADGKQYVVINLTTVFSICTNLMKAGLIYIGVNLVFTLALTAIVNSLQVVYVYWYVKKNYPKINLLEKPNYGAISQRNYTLVHQLSYLVFQNTDILVLTIFCDLKLVSVYSIFKLVTTHVESFLTIITNSVNFHLGYAFQRNREQFITFINIFESVYCAVSTAACSVMYYLLLPFISIYTGGVTDVNYIDPILALLFTLILLLSTMRTPMLTTINIAGHFKLTTPQTIAEAVLNLGVSLLAVQYLGIYGVLIGTIVALLYRTNDIIWYANKKILGRKPWRSYAVHLVNAVLFILSQGIFKAIGMDIENFGQLIQGGIISVLISVPLFLIPHILLFKEVRTFVWKLIKRIRNR